MKMDKFCERLWEEMDKREQERKRKEIERLQRTVCFQCIWSTLRETKLYCPFSGCMKK